MNLIEKNRQLVALSLVAGASAFAGGCGSSNDEAPASEEASGTGGASTSGGSSGTGDTGGNAGAGNATGGGSPWAGSGSARPCTADITELAPSDGMIATFMGEDDFPSQLAAFPPDGPSALTFSTENGALHITADVPVTSMPQFPSVILAFSTAETGLCIDASAFSGVEFSISGSMSGCTMQYATADAAHQDRASGAPIAAGPAGSYQPNATIMDAQLTLEPQTLTMAFVGGPSGGRPATPVDPTQLIFLLWQFTLNPTAGAGTPPCVADITIDDVKFY